jgi:hypothetical protein
MERLTARSVKNGLAYLIKVKPDEQEVESLYPNTLNAIFESFQKLAEYEDKIERGELAEVVRCGECVYYHKAHVLCNDGVERDISELPKEALDFTGTSVTIKYGINVGGQCELEKNCGYAEDKSVFRNPNDFCSRGERSGEKCMTIL